MDRRSIRVYLTFEGSRLRNELPPHAIAVNQLAKGFLKNDIERLQNLFQDAMQQFGGITHTYIVRIQTIYSTTIEARKGIRKMKSLKLFHYLGLILFLGSIFLYILISGLTSHSSLENLVFSRQIIRTGTLFLTIPGLGLVVLSGLIMTTKYYGFLNIVIYYQTILNADYPFE
ncbi:MAG: hypothetical protein IPP67_00060 [Rhodospirillaceae bacterium]|nr:hypothetical protein [Rhodospirillaceae bacterium]